MTRTLNTVLNVQIKVTPNKSQRTFTIRRQGIKFRTLQMSREVFDSADYWTGNDWDNFLKTNEYYIVK
jgi:hypothetical protein